MLEVRNINHHYGRVQVLFDLNFAVNKGEILGFLGPNGAGKSTTMRILTGFLAPAAGSVLFNGADIRDARSGLRTALGYLPENVPLYPELTVQEYLRWVARIKRAAHPDAQARQVADACGLAPRVHTLIRHLSKGYRQRVGLAQAILGETRLLILDEPTVGLDPAQIRDIRELIRELGRDKTILLSTHILPEVERTCDRVLIIDHGRIVAEGKPGDLARDAAGHGRYLLRLDAPDHDAEAISTCCAAVPGVACVTPLGRAHGGLGLSIDILPGTDCRAALTSLAHERGWPVLEFSRTAATLEDAFVRLVCVEGTGSPAPDKAAAGSGQGTGA
ncbi:MAG: ABC transporter ATP-binding protein [Desulfovibrionaceae bacterium]